MRSAPPTATILRRLYVVERMTTRQVAARYGVSKTSVVRWLRAAEITPREASRGLANRGVVAPSAAELTSLVHDQHLSYREIADRFGVHPSAVTHWLRKHAIKPPTVWGTRRRGEVVTMPTANELRYRIEECGESIASIAAASDVSETTIARLCRLHAIQTRLSGWNSNRLTCLDGHQARSVYEQRVDNWLFEHDLEHDCEPQYPWDRRYKADFLAAGVYVEIWGVTHNDRYNERKAMKVARCKEAGLSLIQLQVWDFQRHWQRRLKPLLQNVSA